VLVWDRGDGVCQTSWKEHISVSATPAKLIGNEQTISNGVANFKQTTLYIIAAANTAAPNLIKIITLLPFFSSICTNTIDTTITVPPIQ
jgi:hypothetical protein